MRAALRDPFVHFLLLGLALFGIDAALDPPEPEAATERVALPIPQGPIVVDADVRERLTATWERTHDLPPTEAEMAALVSGWIDREVLYREGLARGLAIDDARIRERVASQMAYVLQEQVVVPEPTTEELERWFEDHPERFTKEGRIDLTHVFVEAGEASDERARELLTLLSQGASPDGLGDTFAGGRRFRGRTLEALRERFGEGFVAGLERQEIGSWSLRTSSHGTHLVRVDRRVAGEPASFASEAVRHDWEADARARALAEATAELRARWEVEES